MPDDGDYAQARAEEINSDALAEHFRRGIRNAMDSAPTHCDDCGHPIPLKRMEAVPGCNRCVSCQEQHEILSNWRAL